nr:MAG TPA: hypothetical protein [Caudoviricetes sp.]
MFYSRHLAAFSIYVRFIIDMEISKRTSGLDSIIRTN